MPRGRETNAKKIRKCAAASAAVAVTHVHTVSHPSSSRFTETCVCQALGKNLRPGACPWKSSWSGNQGRSGTDRRSPCGVTADGRGVGVREGCTEKGALSRILQKVLGSPLHTPSAGVSEHLKPSPHDVEATSPPEEVRSSGPEGSREKAAPVPGAGGSGLLETVSVRQHLEGQIAASRSVSLPLQGEVLEYVDDLLELETS